MSQRPGLRDVEADSPPEQEIAAGVPLPRTSEEERREGDPDFAAEVDQAGYAGKSDDEAHPRSVEENFEDDEEDAGG
jgi:hypothetical protein